MNGRRLAAWAGMIGPVLFVAVFTIEGWLRPGYDPFANFVSALSLGPRGWVQIANFVVLGALLLTFARGVAAAFPSGKASRAGPLLLAIVAVCYLLSGPFVMDPMVTPPAQMSLHGTLHQLFGALVFSLSPIACFVFFRRFRDEPRWRAFARWTLAAGLISVAAVALLAILPAKPYAAPNAFNAWQGVLQRAAIVANMVWLFAFAWKLRGQPAQSAARAGEFAPS
ncbi:MAG TPA: DUF998 domain-containing protein [Rhizomicrobium sp.]